MTELSIVIPTLNEEKCVSNLINDILNSTFQDYEIIVSDSGSEDQTRGIVEKLKTEHPNIKVVNAKRGPPAARNEGAKHSQGEYILFLDADQRITKTFIKNSVEEIKERNLDIGGCYSNPSEGKLCDKIAWFVCNHMIFKPLQYFSPLATTGSGLIIKKSIHDKINGFDENIPITHDHDYVRRSSKEGKFRMLKKERSEFNMRRFNEEGRTSVLIRYVTLMVCHMLRLKETPFKYEFGKHKNNK